MKSSASDSDEIAELRVRIARLEAELAETKRVNDEWRQLQMRSVVVLERIARNLKGLEPFGSTSPVAVRNVRGKPHN
jgi:hypothetical protein